MAYNLTQIARNLNDFRLLIEFILMFAHILLESQYNDKLFCYIADLAVETNQLSFLITAYSRIAESFSD